MCFSYFSQTSVENQCGTNERKILKPRLSSFGWIWKVKKKYFTIKGNKSQLSFKKLRPVDQWNGNLLWEVKTKWIQSAIFKPEFWLCLDNAKWAFLWMKKTNVAFDLSKSKTKLRFDTGKLAWHSFLIQGLDRIWRWRTQAWTCQSWIAVISKIRIRI